MREPERLADLKQAMDLIAEAVEQLPASCRDLAGNAPLNIAADAVADDVGCAEAGRIFSRLADPFGRGHRPPMSNALPLSGFDA
jgi:hypothetical protein